ncbi:M23 family metallopeptidase [Spirochaeta cellobiosiphila]|uniref:M23 family metallopeptidase n=1 Tax=Spirochaeta cellobiosiphila TaxID=504483 RepID=UPI00048CB1CB|nr:M23 family metallopeptidase [Spirochaeta cellobiosiphila]
MITQNIYSFDWPLENPVIVSQFASPQNGQFSKGIYFSGTGMVHAIENGKVIYTNSELPFSSSLPKPLGNMVIIEHSNGYRSIYGNFEKSPFLDENVFSGDVIGYVQSNDSGLYLSLIDIELGKVIQPLLLLPSSADNIKPVLNYVLIEDQNKSSKLTRNGILSDGYKIIKLSTWDLTPGTRVHLLPYKITAYLNGSVLSDITFSGLVSKDGEVVLDQNNMPSVVDLFDENGLIILGREYLSPGENELEIIVKDYFSNTLTQVFPFKVRY